LKTSTFTTEQPLWDWYWVTDPGGVYVDAPGVVEAIGDPGGGNGLIGMHRPWGGTIVPKTRSGRSKLTIEVHDSRPPTDIIADYDRAVEVDFRVVSGEVVITTQGGETIHRLSIPSRFWRLRVLAGGDPEEHLLQFYPGIDQPLGQVVIRA
jgi:hypothetical protein